MALYSVTAQNQALDASLAAFPSPLYLALLTDALDPDGDNLAAVEVPATSEVDDGAGGLTVVSNGYARAAVSSSAWAAATDGEKQTSSPASFGVPDAEWPTVTHWALVSTAGDVYDSEALLEPLEVTDGGGSEVLVTPVIRFDNRIDF